MLRVIEKPIRGWRSHWGYK